MTSPGDVLDRTSRNQAYIYAVPIVIVTRDSKLCVASEEDEHVALKTNATKAFRLKIGRSPGDLPQASRDSYLASCLHKFYFPRGVRLDKGTGKRIVLVALKIITGFAAKFGSLETVWIL